MLSESCFFGEIMRAGMPPETWKRNGGPIIAVCGVSKQHSRTGGPQSSLSFTPVHRRVPESFQSSVKFAASLSAQGLASPAGLSDLACGPLRVDCGEYHPTRAPCAPLFLRMSPWSDRLAERSKPTSRVAEPVRDARYNALMIVFAYLYSGREEQAHQTLRDLWPPFDQERIWNLILEARRNGILCYTHKGAVCGLDVADQ
jgi:hypothetical protein